MSEPGAPNPPSPAPAHDAEPIARARRRRRVVLAATLATPVLLLAYAWLIEPQWIVVTRHSVTLGEDGDTLTVLHLSDLHVRTVGGRERRVLALAREIDPDVIVLTGDSPTSGFDDAALVEVLGGLRAREGVFACMGNWEEWMGERAVACYARAGVRLLRGETASIADGRLVIAGVDGPRDPLPAVPDGVPALLLCHYPAVLPNAAAAGFDLVLVGHTHGGQVRLPFLGALHLPFDSGAWDQGWFEDGATRMYVNRGVGTSIIPLRFACRPEVAVIDVHLPARR